MAHGQNLFEQQGSVRQGTENEIRQLKDRAQRAEAEVARLRQQKAADERTSDNPNKPSQEHSEGEKELRNDSMMAHLLDSLTAGQNIGHYGRLVFAMVCRHFFTDEELVRWLTRDPDFGEAEATNLVRQVEGRDYNPPKRERILEWQAQQEFPIIPNVDDPDCGNLYRNLKFPDSIYSNIEQYQEKKAAAEE
jgi:hypothetical protein